MVNSYQFIYELNFVSLPLILLCPLSNRLVFKQWFSQKYRRIYFLSIVRNELNHRAIVLFPTFNDISGYNVSYVRYLAYMAYTITTNRSKALKVKYCGSTTMRNSSLVTWLFNSRLNSIFGSIVQHSNYSRTRYPITATAYTIGRLRWWWYVHAVYWINWV